MKAESAVTGVKKYLPGALPASLFFAAFSFTVFATQSGDVLIYLAFVRDLIFADSWTRIDPYLYPLGNAELVWTHEYLSYLLFYFFHWILGVPGLILLKVLLLSAMFIVVLRQGPRSQNSSPLWVALWMIAVVAASFRFIERSSLFSDLSGLILVIACLKENRIHQRFLLQLTILFWIWIQLHPAFPIGLAILGLWTLWRTFYDQTVRGKEWLWLLIPVGALLMNPEGLHGALYPFQFFLNEAQTLKKYNFEWFSTYHPAFRLSNEVVAFWFLCGLVLLLFLRQGRKALIDFRFVVTLFAMAMAIQTVRFIPWACFTMLVTVKPWSTLQVWPRLEKKWATVIAVALLSLGVKNLTMGYQSSSGQRLPTLILDPKFFPIQTVAFLKQNPLPGRLYNTHDFGSYLIWSKTLPVFHHGFVTDMAFYEKEVIGVFQSQQNFLALAAKYGWTMLLIEKHGAFRRFYQLLYTLPEWKIVAEDESSYLIYKLP